MTCIVLGYKTKKDLKEAVAILKDVVITDPSIFNPYTGSAKARINTKGSIVVTNHPKRSWFAKIELNNKGELKVS